MSFGAMDKQFAVYLLASARNGTLYVGVTSKLVERIWQHKQRIVEGFTQDNGIDNLVWYELHDDALGAIAREKQIKKWNRAWKVRMIEETNPYWNDLYDDIVK